jgi:hypothetical protein
MIYFCILRIVSAELTDIKNDFTADTTKRFCSSVLYRVYTSYIPGIVGMVSFGWVEQIPIFQYRCKSLYTYPLGFSVSIRYPSGMLFYM